ncbi:MAG: succinate dehydrogenase [Cyanobacteriota bacterium]|nr:succinate dehydrogenase [Cyanobacteriota bacterium]
MAIAASGLVLVLFALVHLAGLGLAWSDPAAFERYASSLHQSAWLPVAEAGLALLLLAHPAQALARALTNRAARGPVLARPRSRRAGGLEPLAALAGRFMAWSGGLLAVFLLVHLAQLRLRRPAAGEELVALRTVLHQPHWLALYAAAGVALAFHLVHGQESAHRRLGLLSPRNAAPIRHAGRVLALVIGAGFTLLPFVLVGAGLP